MSILTWFIIALLGLGSFFAQSSDTRPIESPSGISDRQQYVEDARANPASDLEAQILEDGVITQEEYDQAVSAYVACMDTNGYKVTTQPAPYLPTVYMYEAEIRADSATPEAIVATPSSGMIVTSSSAPLPAEDQLFFATDEECSRGTTFNIEAIYSLQIANPNDVDYVELTIACLVDNDVIAEGELTVEQFDTEMSAESPNLPFDLSDDHVTSCLVNPAQNGINGNPLMLPGPAEATPPSTRMSRAKMVEKVQQNPDSELEARVLEDEVVSADEYQEAVDAYLMCMTDAGYEMQISPAQFVPGMYQYMHDSSATPEAEFSFDHLITVSNDCSVGTTMNIEAIYSDQIINPDDVDPMTLTVSCLETAGMIQEGELTPEQLKAQLSRQAPDLPFDLWDEQAMSCLVNPAQNGINGNPFIEVTPTPAA